MIEADLDQRTHVVAHDPLFVDLVLQYHAVGDRAGAARATRRLAPGTDFRVTAQAGRKAKPGARRNDDLFQAWCAGRDRCLCGLPFIAEWIERLLEVLPTTGQEDGALHGGCGLVISLRPAHTSESLRMKHLF